MKFNREEGGQHAASVYRVMAYFLADLREVLAYEEDAAFKHPYPESKQSK